MDLIANRLRGAVWGLLVGDALGVPYEFHEPEELLWVWSDSIEMEPPAGFARAHRGTPPGTWSDDGAHALCLLASLLERDGFDPGDLAAKLLAWRIDGYMAVDGRVFDCGMQTGDALRALQRGTPPLSAGPSGEYDNGNGSLMRVLPLALWHEGSDAELVELAHQQSQITHGHARSQVCCALYCLWARRILARETDATSETSETDSVSSASESRRWNDAVAVLRDLYGDTPLRAALEDHVRPDDPADGKGTGYVVDTLRTVRCVMEQPSFERVVRDAIGHGRDTDTTACVAGGLAGARHGVAAIPARWLTALRGRELAEPLIEALVARRSRR
jgi:ADP-ribosyl-[dinitrogen reductase] hydrolase